MVPGRLPYADNGTYEPLVWSDDRIEVILHGTRFRGKYILVRFKKAGEKEWLVMKGKE